MTAKKSNLYMIEVQSTHRLYYVVRTDKQPNGNAAELLPQLQELGQQWLGETVCGVYKTSEDEVVKKFDELNGTDFSFWPRDKKLIITDLTPIDLDDEVKED